MSVSNEDFNTAPAAGDRVNKLLFLLPSLGRVKLLAGRKWDFLV